MNEMSNDPQTLKKQQYKNASNLGARIRIHQDYSTNSQSLFTWLFDKLLQEVPANARILELGCGRADLWYENGDRIPEGWQITLTDLSPGMLEDAKNHLGPLATRFTFQEMNASTITYADDAFDVVIANAMLYHVPNLPQTLREIRRVLKPDGFIHAVTMGENHMVELDDLIRQILPDYKTRTDSALLQFAFETGQTALEEVFAQVDLQRFDCDLKVTDTQPLLDYAFSMRRVHETENYAAAQAKLRQIIDDHIAKNGHFYIRKEVGVFVARGIKTDNGGSA